MVLKYLVSGWKGGGGGWQNIYLKDWLTHGIVIENAV